MLCCCNKCKVKIENEWDNIFIADDGRYLCEKCSVGVTPVSEEIRDKLRKYENL